MIANAVTDNKDSQNALDIVKKAMAQANAPKPPPKPSVVVTQPKPTQPKPPATTQPKPSNPPAKPIATPKPTNPPAKPANPPKPVAPPKPIVKKKTQAQCKKIKDKCIDICSKETLPTKDNGFSFFNCVNKCLEKEGC